MLLKPVLAHGVFQLKSLQKSHPWLLVGRACQHVKACVHAEEMWLWSWFPGDFQINCLDIRDLPFEPESKGRGLVFLVWTRHGIASVPLLKKSVSACQSREWTEVDMGLEGRQRLPTSPAITEYKLMWDGFISISRGHSSTAVKQPLVLNHSQPHLINC